MACLLIRAFFAVGFKDVKYYGTNKERGTVNFLGKKNIFFAASIAVIVLGFVFMGINGVSTGKVLNYSLDFVGGTSTNVTFNEDMELSAIDANVVPVFSDVTGDGAVQVQKVANSNEVIFKTRELNVEERQTLEDALVEKFAVNKELITAETIGIGLPPDTVLYTGDNTRPSRQSILYEYLSPRFFRPGSPESGQPDGWWKAGGR